MTRPGGDHWWTLFAFMLAVMLLARATTATDPIATALLLALGGPAAHVFVTRIRKGQP